MQDEQIVDLYFAKDERAIVETNRKYGGYCLNIALKILEKMEDAEEVVNDTWLQAWNTIPPHRPNVLKLYLARITRNLAFSMYRTNMAQKRGGKMVKSILDELDQCISNTEAVDDELDAKELAKSIQKLLEVFPERDQNIFVQRYFYMKEVSEIAKDMGLKASNVYMILSRIRSILKEHLIKEGYNI